jgi:hypothetical protein
MTGRRVGIPFVLSTPTLALRFRQNNGPTPSFFTLAGTHFHSAVFLQHLDLILVYFFARILGKLIGSACGAKITFAKACFGHPSPSKQQKLNATANAFGAPDVLRTCHFATTIVNSVLAS